MLFGVVGTTANDEALKIVEKAYAVEEYSRSETYFAAYDIITEGIVKYANNLILLNNCMGLGLSLSLRKTAGYTHPNGRQKSQKKLSVRQT